MSKDELNIEYIDGPAAPEEDAEATGQSRELAKPDHGLPPNLHILPVGGRPFFPGPGMPIMLPEDPWLESIEMISETPDHVAGILLTRGEAGPNPKPDDFYKVGTAVRIHEPKRVTGAIQLIAEGLGRFQVSDWISQSPSDGPRYIPQGASYARRRAR